MMPGTVLAGAELLGDASATLWAQTDVEDSESMRQSETREMAHANGSEQRDVIVVVCNRFGHERGATSVSRSCPFSFFIFSHSFSFIIGKTFAGSSAMFSMRPGSGKP